MKKLKLFISLWFTMFSVAVFAQAEFEKIAITQNTQDNLAGRLLVQDVTTGEIRYILKSVLDNKFNQPTGNATQYLDGEGNPTTFPVLSQSDRVVTQVRNTTGATVTKGTVVYLTGASGGKPTIQKAQANAESTSSGTFGVIQSDINNNSNGYVVVIGTVLGLNTSSYSEGQILWLSPTTAGGFTTTKPVAPNHAVYVAIVTLASTQGTIEVKIQNGYEIDELHDVLITSKTDNDGLIYDATSGLWKNKQITKSMVGLGNVDNTSDVNKPISTATQNALNLKENTANKNIANGYAGLGSDGKLFSAQLPSITITDTFVVGSQAAMLALTAETGDVAVRTDVNKSYILKGTDPAVLANWQELLAPTSAVTSVFGRNGAVTAQNGDYTTALVTETTNKRYQTDNQQTYNDATSSIQTQLNSKVQASTSTANYLSKFTGSDTNIGNSQIFDNGISVIVGGSGSTGAKLHVVETSTSQSGMLLQNTNTSSTANLFQMSLRGTGKLIEASDATSTLFTVNSSGGGYFKGNTGIGTATPSNILSIEGANQITHKYVSGANISPYAMYFGQFDSSGNAGINNVANADLLIGTNNSEKIRIKPNGNVGIGTNSPGTTTANTLLGFINGSNIQARTSVPQLAFSSNIDGDWYSPTYKSNNFASQIFLDGNGGTIGLRTAASGSTGGAITWNEGIRILSDGKVGIGTTDPQVKLHAARADSGEVARFSAPNGSIPHILIGRPDSTTEGLKLSYDSNTGNTTFETIAAHNMLFKNNNTERMRITSGGSVILGTGQATANSYNFYQNYSNGQMGFDFYNSSTQVIMSFNGNTKSLYVGSLGTGLLYSNAGTLTSTNPSDSRLKDNITDLQYGLNEILKLRPVSYNWKNDKVNQGKQFGFIAQEVQEVMPELVKEFKTEEGNRLGLDKEGIYAALVNAIKEQQSQIKELQKEIDILKNK